MSSVLPTFQVCSHKLKISICSQMLLNSTKINKLSCANHVNFSSVLLLKCPLLLETEEAKQPSFLGINGGCRLCVSTVGYKHWASVLIWATWVSLLYVRFLFFAVSRKSTVCIKKRILYVCADMSEKRKRANLHWQTPHKSSKCL